MFSRLHPYRLEFFFFSQIAILFGSIIMPLAVYESFVAPLLFIFNLLAGILVISKKKYVSWFLSCLVTISSVILILDLSGFINNSAFSQIRMAIYFLFYVILTYEIIKQVWEAKQINKGVIFGLISGYISLGLIGFFICLSIELTIPNSFKGVVLGTNNFNDGLLYYSYITLSTIGYGDVLPVNSIAQKAAILIGFMGQFYLAIVSAIVVGKYINQLTPKN